MGRILLLALLLYPAMPKTGSFGHHLAKLRAAASTHDMKSFARLTTGDFTVGEELDRASSLALVHLPAVVRLIDRGACYRTGPGLVQCELPDPGPSLDHTKLSHSTIAIFEHTKHGWRLGLFSA